MVFKAKIKEYKTYYLCARREKVTSEEYIRYRESGELPDISDLIVFIQDKIVRIPVQYRGSFNENDFTCKCIETSKYQKEMYPDLPIFEKPLIGGMQEDCNWLTYDSIGLCTKDMMVSSTGTWTEDKSKVVYKYENNVKVLKEGCARHKKDKEFEELTVNTQTGECVLVQRYFNGMMSTNRYIFNKQYRVWVMTDTKVERDIISVKR